MQLSHKAKLPVPKNKAVRGFLRGRGFTIFGFALMLLNAYDFAQQLEEARNAPEGSIIAFDAFGNIQTLLPGTREHKNFVMTNLTA